jgi:hypothetical protein
VFTSSSLVACLLGVILAGLVGDRFGRRSILIVSAVLFMVSGVGSAIPQSFGLLVATRLVCGVSVGLASVVAPMYISEFAPPKWRGRSAGRPVQRLAAGTAIGEIRVEDHHSADHYANDVAGRREVRGQREARFELRRIVPRRSGPFRTAAGWGNPVGHATDVSTIRLDCRSALANGSPSRTKIAASTRMENRETATTT